MDRDSVVLVRHTEVALKWRGRCYGRSDAGLSRAGAAALRPLAEELARRLRPQWVVHSDMARTRPLAAQIARLAGCAPVGEPLWRERDFGLWEAKSWLAIYRQTANAMEGMITAPDTFRPGGGETTFELARRIVRAWNSLPEGRGIVVTHGGPIAALLGTLRALPPDQWPALIPPTGGSICLPRNSSEAHDQGA